MMFVLLVRHGFTLFMLYCTVVVLSGSAVFAAQARGKGQYQTTQLELQSQLMSFADHFAAEVDVNYDSQEREAPATVTFTANGRQIGQGRIERSVPGTFTASETFDVGMDLGSPVSLDYHEKAPFAFNGRIHKIHIKYTDAKEPEIPIVPED